MIESILNDLIKEVVRRNPEIIDDVGNVNMREFQLQIEKYWGAAWDKNVGYPNLNRFIRRLYAWADEEARRDLFVLVDVDEETVVSLQDDNLAQEISERVDNYIYLFWYTLHPEWTPEAFYQALARITPEQVVEISGRSFQLTLL